MCFENHTERTVRALHTDAGGELTHARRDLSPWSSVLTQLRTPLPLTGWPKVPMERLLLSHVHVSWSRNYLSNLVVRYPARDEIQERRPSQDYGTSSLRYRI